MFGLWVTASLFTLSSFLQILVLAWESILCRDVNRHQQLASYASCSLVKHRWEKVFRHEHVSLIWLRQQSPFQDTYKKCKDTYFPQQCSTPEYCFCGMSFGAAGTCIFCASVLSQEIAACAVAGKITTKMRQILDEAQK